MNSGCDTFVNNRVIFIYNQVTFINIHITFIYNWVTFNDNQVTCQFCYNSLEKVEINVS